MLVDTSFVSPGLALPRTTQERPCSDACGKADPSGDDADAVSRLASSSLAPRAADSPSRAHRYS